MTSSFSVTVPGKWVLTGEHSVLRGKRAIAFPHPEFHLTFRYHSSDFREIQPYAANESLGALLDSLSISTGVFQLESSIPIQAGLGSSAAICVAIAQWRVAQGMLKKSEIFDFAKNLEDLFHGKSSGMDISVIAQDVPICFSIEKGGNPLSLSWKPKWTFHDTGLRSPTKECVHQVNEWVESNPHQATILDQQMENATEMALDSLQSGNLEKLRDSMKHAQEVFYAWGLISYEIEQLEKKLYEQGALAVKLTGAGKGGFLVALWS